MKFGRKSKNVERGTPLSKNELKALDNAGFWGHDGIPPDPLSSRERMARQIKDALAIKRGKAMIPDTMKSIEGVVEEMRKAQPKGSRYGKTKRNPFSKI